jgi:hypothetical protein
MNVGTGSLDNGWLIFIFSPSGFVRVNHRHDDQLAGRGGRIPIFCRPHLSLMPAFIQVVNGLAEGVTRGWKTLWAEITEIFNAADYATYLNPEAYVHLLYDGATFPRSRFYFWAIGCFTALEDNLRDNVENLRSFLYKIAKETKSASKKETDDIQKQTQTLEEVCNELDGIRAQIQKRLEDVRALRDGVNCKPL